MENPFNSNPFNPAVPIDVRLVGDLATLLGGSLIDWQASATLTGFSSTSVRNMKYIKTGKLVALWYDFFGVSNTTTLSVTLPFPCAMTTGIPIGGGSNNSVVMTAPGRAVIDVVANASLMTFYRDIGTTAWTNGNNKGVAGFIMYPTTV